jgi:hypothetical protein
MSTWVPPSTTGEMSLPAVIGMGSDQGLAAASNGFGIFLAISLDGVLFLLVLFGLGLLMIYSGFREYQVGQLIRDTATETVNAAAVGRTELEGTVERADMLFAQPFRDRDAVYVSYQIQEERQDGDGDTSWTTLDQDTWVTPFYVDDGTGQILVDPDISAKYEISDEYTSTFTVPEGGSDPAAIAEFLEQGTDVDPTEHRKRRYTQQVIPPGETVYVLGGAEILADAEGREEKSLVIRRDDGSDRFVISDMTEESLTSTLSRRAPLLILVGLGLSAVCLYLLLTELGVG